MVTIPPTPFHRIQPLAVMFYGQLIAAQTPHVTNLIELIQKADLHQLILLSFNKSVSHVVTLEKATKGFEVTGIYSANSDIFHRRILLLLKI